MIRAILLLLAVTSAWALQGPTDPVTARIADLQSSLLQWYKLYVNATYGGVDPDDNKVVGGVDAKPGEAPFQAQLHIRSPFSGGLSFTCGGSIINSKTILTAAHCADFANDYRIRYGSNSRLSSNFPLAEVQQIKIHPQWNLDTITHDVALFILRNPIQPGSNVAAINLQQSNVSPSTTTTLFGFGLMNGRNQNSLAERLQKAQLEVVSERDCNAFFNQLSMRRTPGHLCVAASNRGSCNGDSGGPLLVSSSGNQVGIVSFGLQGCPPGAIDVFTNIPYYLGWIRSNMAGGDGPSQPDQPDKPAPPTSKPTTKRPFCRWVCGDL